MSSLRMMAAPLNPEGHSRQGCRRIPPEPVREMVMQAPALQTRALPSGDDLFTCTTS